ncbi:MAG: hypothetical protein ACI8QS_002998 [Planctomycetota bacterium]|jgi:hypothetical protein
MLRPTLYALGFASLLSPLSGVVPGELATTYSTDRELTLTLTYESSLETVSSSFEVDGEPVEGRGGAGGGGGSSEERRMVIRDRVLSVEDGVPTKVRRTFDKMSGSSSAAFGDQEMESELESPFDGITLELTGEDGEVEIEVVDGDAPAEEHLVGQVLGLTIDALLPESDAEEGDTWTIEGDALAHALMIDLQSHYFARPERDAEERGGGGRRGPRGGGGRTGGGVIGLLSGADLTGDAELVAAEEDGDDGPVARVRFTAEASGEVEQQAQGGGDRGGRGGGGEGETTYTVELEGELVFSLKDHRPVSLEVEAKVTRISDRTFDRGERSMRSTREEEGTLEISLEVSSEAVSEDD